MKSLAFRLAAVVWLGTSAVGCTGGTAPAEPFGFHYQVVFEEPPVLSDTTVSLTVSYGGCRDNHTFILQAQDQASSTAIWLKKLTPDEPCDMLVTERRGFSVPQRVRDATVVILLSPNADPFQLRP